jgi:uncharacterized protein (DUF2345 family)
MRVRLQGWLRSITLEPWHESEPGPEQESLDVTQLRRLLADEPGTAASLRALLYDLGDVSGLGFITDDELAERVASLVARRHLRVQVERYLPMASETIELGRRPRYEPAPLEVDDDDHHFVEVELLDEAGAPVQGERCRIVLPNGSERYERTDHDGLVRVDRTVAGQCTISFPDLDAGATGPLTSIERQGTQVVPSKPKQLNHWIEVELLGEDGAAIAGERCEITLPDGEVLRRKTDASGLVRVPRIAMGGDCQIRFPDIDAGAIEALTTVARQGTQVAVAAIAKQELPNHWIEVELVGEDGTAIAGERCEITLPDGEVVRRKTDASGLVRIPRIAAAGDCEIRFPDIDAGAVAAMTTVARTGAGAARASAVGEPAKSTHWVEVELLDESGAAIANVPCEITLPDGQVVRRRTDASGRIRLSRIAATGECQISFIELDASAWQGVVGAATV